MASRMFPFITRTWNPLGGECRHGCVYCWARKLAAERKMAKYQGEARVHGSGLKWKFKPEEFVFVCDMVDLLGAWVHQSSISFILDMIKDNPKTNFLLLTKNPKRYLELLDFLPTNVVLGCTLESNLNYSEISKAPSQFQRLYWFTQLAEVERLRFAGDRTSHKLFVSVEPILDFNFENFVDVLCNWIKPWAVAVGYDNYGCGLPEPPLAKTMQFIEALEKAGITVYKKTLREAWDA